MRLITTVADLYTVRSVIHSGHMSKCIHISPRTVIIMIGDLMQCAVNKAVISFLVFTPLFLFPGDKSISFCWNISHT